MEKTRLGATTFVFPMPAFLVGANINNQPNFLTAAWGSMACGTPPMVSIAINHSRYTLEGIKENGVFSVCVPSVEQVTEVDCCGLYSGSHYDKVAACKFKTFYGELLQAPMIEQCPICLECRVVQMPNLGGHVLVIGEIIETYVDKDCLTDGKPDVRKIRPLIYSSGNKKEYFSFGESIAPAYSKGKELKERLNEHRVD